MEPRIVVSLRPIVKASCLTSLPQRLPSLFAYLLKNGVHFAIALGESPESGLREVIHVLKEEGYLTRHQELAAYLAFDIPYSPEGRE
jgi:hypothetical protein